MQLQENFPLRSKTTMRIGGVARYLVELQTPADVEDVVILSEEKKLPLVMVGGGSNTIFADGLIEAVVCKISAERLIPSPRSDDSGIVATRTITVEAGKILACLINELAEQDLDLSPLTGIPGTVGGAIFGNAGQGFGGTWIDTFIREVTFYHEKQWKTWAKEQCGFGYRESFFKRREGKATLILWSATLHIPVQKKAAIQSTIETLLQKRIATQPHLKTAGSCFASLPDGTPAWKLIANEGLRGLAVGDLQIAEKHANFLLNTGHATFQDVTTLITLVQQRIPSLKHVEMRLYDNHGNLAF